MKQLIILSVSLLLCSSLFAQIDFGVKGGLNLATVRYINDDNSKARAGINAGFFVNVPVEDNLFFRPEVLYSSKGFAFSATSLNDKGSLRLNYFAMPLLAGYKATNKLDLMAGPELGFLLKAVSKSEGITDDRTGLYRSFDLGVDLGAAYNFSKYFGGEVRYNYGFKDLVNVVYLNDNGNVTGQGKTGANSVIQLGFFYYLSR